MVVKTLLLHLQNKYTRYVSHPFTFFDEVRKDLHQFTISSADVYNPVLSLGMCLPF